MRKLDPYNAKAKCPKCGPVQSAYWGQCLKCNSQLRGHQPAYVPQVGETEEKSIEELKDNFEEKKLRIIYGSSSGTGKTIPKENTVSDYESAHELASIALGAMNRPGDRLMNLHKAIVSWLEEKARTVCCGACGCTSVDTQLKHFGLTPKPTQASELAEHLQQHWDEHGYNKDRTAKVAIQFLRERGKK